MEILIRQTGSANQTDAAFTDLALDVKSLSIGSASDQALQLSGAGILPNHAVLSHHAKGVRVACFRGATVSINGTEREKTDLMPGDIIELGGNTIEVVSAPAGFDVAIVVIKNDTKDTINYEQAYQTDLSQTKLAPRFLGWVLSLAVLVVAVVIPLGYHYTSQSGSPLTAAALSWPISDTVWSSGPLHDAHASLGENCSSCHVELFQKVTNESCENCHNDTQDHITAVSQNKHLPIEINGTCASCHREHNEPVSSLIITSNSLCVDCHAPHDLQSEDATLARVDGFGVDTHPQFQVSLLVPPTGGSFDTDDEWSITRKPLTEAKENSQLKFNHEVHYDNTKVALNGDSTLSCAQCHDLSVDGEHFQSIEFEKNCANSGCHELDLDPRNRLPHGMPDVTVAAIEGYYLRKFGNPEKSEPATPGGERRRLLDRGANDDEACTGNNYECALELAAKKVTQQFNVSGCVTCHTVNDVGGDVHNRYEVAVVKLNEDYLANARFDHLAHGVLVEPNGVDTHTGDESCVYCHAAPMSSKAEDVLIPAIDNCTTCHNGPEQKLNVPLGCIDCHAYHEAI